jgi:hypothetical protein
VKPGNKRWKIMTDKCPYCNEDMIPDSEFEGELICVSCEEVKEEVLEGLRNLDHEELKKTAACWVPLPRRMWPGENFSDAQIREYVHLRVESECERRKE